MKKLPVVPPHSHSGDVGGETPPLPHHADHETGGSDAITALAATVINSGTLDGDRLPAISTSKKGAVPATGTPAGHFLRDDGTFVDIITFGEAPGSPYDGQLTQDLDDQGDPGKFALQLREHKYYASYNPENTFSKPTAASLKCLSSAAGRGRGYAFVTLDKDLLIGKKVKLTWETFDDHPSHLFDFLAEIADGAYSRSSATDFPTGASYLLKGAGMLQSIEHIYGVNASHTKTITASLAASTQANVTIMVYIAEGSGTYQGYFTITGLQITDIADRVEYEADLTGTLTMESTGGTADYGILGSDQLGAAPDNGLKAWNQATATWDKLAEPYINAGLESQYFRGDKVMRTLNGVAVANTPAGDIAATDVQAALNELDTEKQSITGMNASVVASFKAAMAALIVCCDGDVITSGGEIIYGT